MKNSSEQIVSNTVPESLTNTRFYSDHQLIIAALLVGIASTCMFIGVSANALLYVILQRYLDMQWGKGFVIAAYFVPAIIGNRVFDAIVQRRSPAVLASGAALMTAAMFILQSVSIQSWQTMLLTRVVQGLCVGIFVPAVMILGRQALAKRGESAFGIFSLCIPLASIMGPGIAEYLLLRSDVFHLFIVLAIFCTIAAILLITSNNLLRRSTKEPVLQKPSANIHMEESCHISRHRQLFLIGSISIGVAGNLISLFIAPKVISDHLSSGLFFLCATITLVIARVAMTFFPAIRFGSDAIPLLSAGLLASVLLAFAPVSHAFVLLGAVGFGFFHAMLFPKLIFLSKSNSSSHVYRHIGNMNLIIALCGFSISIVIGALNDHFNVGTLGIVISTSILIGILLFQITLRLIRQ
ncbi:MULTISPECIES: MFS transporter [unclassified Serratia (in: enterobacteria)]|uniref:MFS transporter n=1 Tax=unclassified Serratia (in: enterobacteria) TaxID=2647522 RepID=UPI003076091F